MAALSLAVSQSSLSATNGTYSATRGQYVSFALSASGGVPPYSYAAVLPQGLQVDRASGVISGVVWDVGRFEVLATVTDAIGASAIAPVFALRYSGMAGPVVENPAPLRFASALNLVLRRDDTSAYTNMRGRVPIIIGSGDLSELTLMAYGWKNVLNTGYVAATNAFTIVRIALEKSGGGYAPVTFGGSEGITINPGDTDIKSDPVLPAAFGLSKFSRGEVYYVRYELSVASAGQAVPYGGVPTGVGGVSWHWFNPATTSLSPVYGTGAISVVSGSDSALKAAGWSPVALGKFIGVEPLVYYGGGDSILQGIGDSNTAATIGSGLFQRQMADADGVSNYMAGFNGGSQGTTAAQLVANTRLLAFMKYANRMISELGTNDVNINTGAGSIATLQANLLSIWASARAAGIQKILHTYITPNTSSTDTWLTLVNQTPYVAAYGLGGSVQTHNAWIASKVGVADGIDLAIPASSIRGSSDPLNGGFYKWIVDGVTPNYATSDRVHPNPPATILFANEVRAGRQVMG